MNNKAKICIIPPPPPPLPSCGSDGKSSVSTGLQQQQKSKVRNPFLNSKKKNIANGPIVTSSNSGAVVVANVTSVSTRAQQQQQQQQQHQQQTAKIIRNPYQKKRKAPALIPPPLSIASNPWTKILLLPCFLVKDVLVYYLRQRDNGAVVVHVANTTAMSTGVHAIHNAFMNKNSSSNKKKSTPPSPLLPYRIDCAASSNTYGQREGSGRATANSRTIKRKCSTINNDKKKKKKTTPSLLPRSTNDGVLPLHLFIEVLGYLDPESLRIAYLLSRQIRFIIHNSLGDYNGNQLELISLLQISPAGNKDDEGRFERLLEQMYKRRDQLQRYREIKIIGFNNSWVIHDREAKNRIVRKLRESNFKLKGVVSMNFPSPWPSYNQNSDFLVTVLATALPNLREVNLSNINTTGRALKTLSTRCSRLVKITHNNIQDFLNIDIDGGNMIRAKNLKELYMDASVFKDTQSSVDRMSDLDDNNDNLKNVILFYKCNSNVLERVSIKNAHCFNGNNNRTTPLSQKALIKFVRNAPPSLRWFRSSLTDANINMLRSERPEIELVN